MASDDAETNVRSQSPDDAFAVLGNETRMSILWALGEADGPLSFSDLQAAVGTRDSGRFNYHLEKLVGHFVRKTEEGYSLRQAGTRVIEAVHAGTVTDAPVREATQIDQSCPYCGAPVEVSFREERVELFCTDCAGVYGRVGETEETDVPAEYGAIGGVLLPPAGVQDRTAAEMTQAAFTWANLEFAAAASGVCPRCSAPFEQSVTACEAHDHGDGICEECGRRHAVQVRNRCTNCNFSNSGTVTLAVLDHIEFLRFLVDHDINPVTPSPEGYLALETTYEEELVSADPFEARFTFTVDGESLTLTLDEDLRVVDATRHEAGESA